MRKKEEKNAANLARTIFVVLLYIQCGLFKNKTTVYIMA
jgi:hypothetical protein